MKRTVPALILLATLISLLATVINMPSATPYSPFNSGSRGYSELVKLANAQLIQSISDIGGDEVGNKVLIMLATRNISSLNANLLRKLVKEGLTLILLDEHGFVNNVLENLNIEALVSNVTVLDEILKLNSRFYPVIKLHYMLGNGSEILRIATYMPAHIVFKKHSSGGEFGRIKGVTSNYTYADIDGNGYYSIGEKMGSFLIVYSWSIGRGKVVLISDLDVWSNDLIFKEDNAEFLRLLTGSKETYVLASAMSLEPIDEVKVFLASLGLGKYKHYSPQVVATIGFIILTILLLVVKRAEQT